MKKIVFLGLVGLMGLAPARAQHKDNPVVMEVGGHQIRQQEFMHDFMQSVGDNLVSRHASESEKRRAMEEYVELYANFRAKLLDAHREGLDTAQALHKELGQYRSELAAPYLIDSAMQERIMREAYDRNHYALHAAHILVRVDPDAAPADTLAAYSRAMDYRQRVLAGEDFHALATEEALSQNPNAKVNPYEGELDCFTVFDMVYPFESAAYDLQPGEVSLPVRSRFGYHIIKLFDRTEFYGKVTIQHYWKQDRGAEMEARNAYDRLMTGTKFDIVASQSDDRSTSRNGGYIVDATMRQLPHEYVRVIGGMKEGEVSEPFLTRYGWHIVRLVKRDTMPPYEKMLPYYRQRMGRDPRGTASRKVFASHARQKYAIVDYTATPVATKGKKRKGKKAVAPAMMASLDGMAGKIEGSVFNASWKMTDSLFSDTKALAHVPGRDYTERDFAAFIARNQKREQGCGMDYYLRREYADFLDSIAIAYADSQLEREHPDFAEVVEEYRRGLLIFNYNEKMIWRKAIDDSAGFADYYGRESVKKSMDVASDSVYFWHTRARVVVFDVGDSQCLDSDKAAKLLRKALAKEMGSAEMSEMLTAKVNRKRCSADEPVRYRIELVEQGYQSLLGEDQWKEGVYVQHSGKGYRLTVVQAVLSPMLKGHMEARGYYLNGWQNEVEKNLNAELRKTYRVKINHNVVDKIRF